MAVFFPIGTAAEANALWAGADAICVTGWRDWDLIGQGPWEPSGCRGQLATA
jgi:hypothetical protein